MVGSTFQNGILRLPSGSMKNPPARDHMGRSCHALGQLSLWATTTEASACDVLKFPMPEPRSTNVKATAVRSLRTTTREVARKLSATRAKPVAMKSQHSSK